MKTVRGFFYRELAGSVAFVGLAFMSLFFFIDFIEQMTSGGGSRLSLQTAAWLATLEMPARAYELSPIALLIGTIYALARMAQASEFTVLRSAGLGPGRALHLLLLPAALVGLATFALGEWIVPPAETQALKVSAQASGRATVGASGVWLKDASATSPRARSTAVHIQAATASGELLGVRLYEFDESNRLVRRLSAKSAVVEPSGGWVLREVTLADTVPIDEGRSQDPAASGVVLSSLPSLVWRASLTPGVVSAAVLPAQTMSTLDLWRYGRHLSLHEQAALRYEQQFLKRVLYPLACVVMVALALPFAYLHARSGGVSLKVFGGILLGISFVLVNNVFSHVGLLKDWSPWVAASMPSLVYLMLAMAAFAWVVRYR